VTNGALVDSVLGTGLSRAQAKRTQRTESPIGRASAARVALVGQNSGGWRRTRALSRAAAEEVPHPRYVHTFCRDVVFPHR
jgi:hypothetical protein